MNTTLNSKLITLRAALRCVAFAVPLSALLSGCASMQAKSLALEESHAEQQRLYTQNAALGEDVARLQNECDQLALALEAATADLEQQQSAQTAFPDLEAAGISVERRGSDVVFTIPSAVTFGSGKATISSSGRDALRTLAGRLRSEFAGDAVFHVEGHTDSDPIRKSKFESNRHLSIRRSMAVVDYLVRTCKIADERFVVAGFGQHRPVTDNQSAAAKARNRRVEVVVRQGR